MNDQHFQIPIRSGTHGHVSTSSYELLSDPLVNKLQFFYFLQYFTVQAKALRTLSGSVHIVRKIVITISVFISYCTLFLPVSLGPRKKVVFIWFHCQRDGYISAHPFILGYEENRLQGEG